MTTIPKARRTTTTKILPIATKSIKSGLQSKGHVSIGEEYELGKLMVSLRGNQAALKIDGEGKYDCGTPELKGNGPVFECKN